MIISRLVATILIVVVLATVATACADDGATSTATSTAPTTGPSSVTTTPPAVPSTTRPHPDAEWTAVSPDDVGLDREALADIAGAAEVGNSHCLAVVRDGALAGEWYFDGTDAHTTQNVFSATKSITSILVGIAQSDGDLDIGESASTWITEWKGTPSETVTVRDLLSNDSGRDWSIAQDYVQLIKAPDKTAFAIGLGQAHEPGEVWAYNNSAIQALERILEVATGQDVATFARERLFGPLGMTDTRMSTDASGHAQMFQGVTSSCRDLARFGTMLLDDGEWGDEQIVPAAYVAEATGASSQSLNQAYGYLFWLNRKGTIVSPLVATGIGQPTDAVRQDAQLAAGAPEDMFWALGLGNQIVQVDPGSRTVVVRLGTAATRPTPPTFGPAKASRVVTEAVTGG